MIFWKAIHNNDVLTTDGQVAKLFADSGSVSLCAFVSPYKKDRELARRLHLEVQVKVFLSSFEMRFRSGWFTFPRGIC